MENVSNMSLIEVAVKVCEERHAPININDLIDEVLELKGVTDDDSKADLYVDITTSSTFVYLGEGMWDLKINQTLAEFDKDGSAFTSKDEEYVEEEPEFEEEDDDEDSEYDEDEDEDSEYDEDEDEDEESDDRDSEREYEDEEDETEYSEEDDFEEEDDYDEEKYNKIMDDYEDMYGDN